MHRRLITITITTAAILLSGCGGKKAADSPAAAPAASAVSAPAASTSSAPADNGVAALTADQILERAKTALKAANAFHVKGSVVDKGQRTTMDFKTRAGALLGSLAIGKAKIELLTVAGKQYMRPNEAFWATSLDRTKAHTMAKLMGDKWAKIPDKNQDFTNLFSAASIDELLKPGGKLTKGQTKEVDGVPAIGLVENSSDGGTLWVATTGEAYPLRLQPKNPSEGGIAFSEFGATFPEIKAPPEAQVIDFETLTRS